MHDKVTAKNSYCVQLTNDNETIRIIIFEGNYPGNSQNIK